MTERALVVVRWVRHLVRADWPVFVVGALLIVLVIVPSNGYLARVSDIIADWTYPVWVGLLVFWAGLVLLTMDHQRWRSALAAALIAAAGAFGVLCLSTGTAQPMDFQEMRPLLRTMFAISALFFMLHTLQYIRFHLQWNWLGMGRMIADMVRRAFGRNHNGNGAH